MQSSALVAAQQRRPWPVPKRPWIMAQRWHDLLFAHWPVRPDALRPLVPAALDLDTFEGEAWVGIIPFRMSGVRPRGLPSVPWLSEFPEMNLRTYVTLDGKPGVWFFSLDAGNPVAVAIARATYHLPYFDAAMRIRRNGDTFDYGSIRTHHDAPPASVHVRYRPAGPVFESRPGTLESWLTDRYCLYAMTDSQHLYRGEIHHAPWSLQLAEAEFERQTLALAHGIILSDKPPLLHFSRLLEMVAWLPERVR